MVTRNPFHGDKVVPDVSERLNEHATQSWFQLRSVKLMATAIAAIIALISLSFFSADDAVIKIVRNS